MHRQPKWKVIVGRAPRWCKWRRGRRQRPSRWLSRIGKIGVKALVFFTLLSIALVLPLRWIDPPSSSFMLQHSWYSGVPIANEWRPLESIAPALAMAVIAAEDQRFPEHRGIDFRAVRRAFRKHRSGRPLRGASTISQQVAKNLYLWSGRSLLRKSLEAWLTLWLEMLLPKRRILEVYLNIAQFGSFVYGAEAASLHYFGVRADSLSRQQAASLATALPAPSRYKVDMPTAYLRQRQAWILQQMRQLGGLSYLDQLYTNHKD